MNDYPHVNADPTDFELDHDRGKSGAVRGNSETQQSPGAVDTRSARRRRASRKTVRRALGSPVPPPLKTPQRISTGLSPSSQRSMRLIANTKA